MLRFTNRCFGKALVVAEVAGGKVVPATFSAITAALKCGPVSAFIASGDDAGSVASQLASVKGVEEVFVASGAQFARGLPEEVAPVVSSVAGSNGFTHVFAATSAFGKNVIPRCAASADSMPISEITAVQSEDTFVRQTYAGNAICTVKSSDKVKFGTVRGTSFDRAGEGGSAKITKVDAPAPKNVSKWIEDLIAASDKPELTTASIVIAGGRGLKEGSNFKLLDELAAPLKAAVGATRAAVDAGYCPNDMQIGQTGKTIAPNLYIGAGISGAIQHVAGMKESKTIAVINTDADAPFFQLADYGLVADLFQAVPELTKLVKK